MFCRCEFTLTEWHHANTVNDNIESHQDRWWKLPPIKQRTVESLINNPTPFLLLLLPFHLSSGLSFLITIICCLLMISKYQIHSNNFQNSLSYTHHTSIYLLAVIARIFVKSKIHSSVKVWDIQTFWRLTALMHFLPSEESKIVVRHFCSVHFLALASH